ncbi:MAG TPA: hypothetical protein VF155_07905 [Candidatus Dormibacteraeota bacterium]
MTPVPRIIDTSQAFDTFAGEVELETPLVREVRWRDQYEAGYTEVFEAFYEAQGSRDRPAGMLHNLSRVRKHAREAAAALPEIIETVDEAVGRTLGFEPGDGPVHVLLVGTAGANAVVGRLGDETAVFHSLEWFQAPEPARVAVAHETAHGWHQKHLSEAPPANDAAWPVFEEGLAVQTSRAVVPGRPEDEYFWYGLEGFDHWAAWCADHAKKLRHRMHHALEDPSSLSQLFGSGAVEGHHRTGYHVADGLVAEMQRPLNELARLSPAEASAAIREALRAAH